MPKAEQLSSGAVKLFKEPQIANFVTLMADGSPQVTPVWVDVTDDGQHILVNTAEGRVKSNNTIRNPAVAISIVDNNDPFRWVSVRGQVVEHRQQGARDHIDALAKKYTGAEKYTPGSPDEQRVIIVIKPHNVTEQGTA